MLWETIEQSPGNFTISGRNADVLKAFEAIGNKNCLILCYGNSKHNIGLPLTAAEREKYLAYVTWLVPRVAHCVSVFEVWNEWNIWLGGTPAQKAAPINTRRAEFAQLIIETAKVVRRLAPGAQIISGGTAGGVLDFNNELIARGVLDFVDGIGIHPYNYPRPAVEALTNVDRMALSLSAAADRRVPIYFTEMGWPTHEDATTGTAATRAAVWGASFYHLCAQRNDIAGVWWYDLFDDGVDPKNREHRFGLVSSDGKKKPAYDIIKSAISPSRAEIGLCLIGVTQEIEDLIAARGLPDRVLRDLSGLRATGESRTVYGQTLKLLSGPLPLAVIPIIKRLWLERIELLEGPVVLGRVPEQTSFTRDPMWPNGW